MVFKIDFRTNRELIMSKNNTVVKLFTTLILILISSHSETVFSQMRCENLFKNIKTGSEILHERDNQLHTIPSVKKVIDQHKRKTKENISRPTDKITLWLDYLNNITSKANTSPTILNLVKKKLLQSFCY